MTDDFNQNDFNPDLNYEDAELVAQAEKLMKATQYAQQKEFMKQHQKKITELQKDVLREEGLDETALGALGMADPQHYYNATKEGFRTQVRALKKGRDAQGRFTSQPGRPETGPNKTIEALREKSKKQQLSHEDELDIIDALFPGGL